MTAIKDRDYFFDNARAILIFLVVLGHLLQPYTSEDKFLQALYLLIYSFHMPTFLFISGYFAKNLDKPNYLEKIAKSMGLSKSALITSWINGNRKESEQKK